MTLELGSVHITAAEFGHATRVTGNTLTVDRDALREELLRGVPGLDTVRVHIVRPGESARVVCVKDVVEPRVKVAGEEVGQGRTHALRGVAVATCGQIVGFQEGLIDMTGPGAAYSPFSALWLVVVEAEVEAGLAPHRHEAALRAAGLLAAELLGRAAAGVEPDVMETFGAAGLPARVAHGAGGAALLRVAYVEMLLSQGLLHDTYVLGRHAGEGLPRLVDPAIVIDGGVVSGNCVSACDKNTTYHHQNNPVIRELQRRHGRELEFSAVVLTNVPTRLGEKVASTERAVELVAAQGVDAALISKEGFGNPDADLMLLIRGLERAGIRTVAITDEFAGGDGGSQSLADAAEEADAIVSVGNANERIVLPPVERTVGPLHLVPRLAGAHAGSTGGDGSVEVELQSILGATNQLGMQRLSCREV